MIPGETETDALEELEALFAHLQAHDPDLHVSIDHLVPTTGGSAQVGADNPVVALAREAAADILNAPPELTGFGGACDMAHLVNAGVPTVVFGLGDTDQARRPDEHIKVDDLVNCARVYLLTALRYLTQKDEIA
jgi:acetylornithine deacetylase/succinyl-diaminopimelate desuccinylase-like protein